MKRLPPYMNRSDARGAMTGITQDAWHEANFVESKADVVRGGHYHQDTLELFYIISGSIDVETVHMDSGARAETTLNGGDILVIEPMEWHRFTTRSDCQWINMLSQPFDPDRPDMHVPDALPEAPQS